MAWPEDSSGCHTIDPHRRGQFPGQRERHAFQPGLGNVVDGKILNGPIHHGIENIDDVALTACELLAQGHTQKIGSTQIAVYEVVPLSLGGVFQLRRIERRGVVDQHVDAAETVERVLCQLSDFPPFSQCRLQAAD